MKTTATIERPRNELWESLELMCIFGLRDGYYACEAKKLNITSAGVKVSTVFGRHEAERLNRNVTLLVMDDNYVTNLPLEIADVFPNLLKLQVKNANLHFLARKNFNGLAELLDLNLSHNRIWHIPQSAFLDLLELQVLNLDFNQIRALSDNAFVNLLKLREIYLEGNVIDVLNVDVFRNNRNLQIADFDKNRIYKIHGDLFIFLTNIQSFYLFENNCIRDNFYRSTAAAKIEFFNKVKTCCNGTFPGQFYTLITKLSVNVCKLLTTVGDYKSGNLQ